MTTTYRSGDKVSVRFAAHQREATVVGPSRADSYVIEFASDKGEGLYITRVPADDLTLLAEYRPINRQYEDLLARIMDEGVDRPDRTGTGTRGLFGAQLRFNLETEGFPLITTKKVFMRGLTEELLWMLNGDNRVSTLRDKNVNIWNEWALEDDTIGAGYGVQWRNWVDDQGRSHDQIANLLDSLRNDPNSRRHIVSAWNVGKLDQMALVPCHAFFQFHVANRRLSCQLYQRSADMFLGVPFNIAFYSLLTHMLAQQLDYTPGDFVWTGGDVHIYANHFEQVREQLSREPFPFPTLTLDKAPSLFDYSWEAVHIKDYQHHPTIKAPVSV